MNIGTCCYCFKPLRFWQRHNACSHDVCQKIHRNGYERAWQLARDVLLQWNLPSLDELASVKREYECISDEQLRKLILKEELLYQTIQERFSMPQRPI